MSDAASCLLPPPHRAPGTKGALEFDEKVARLADKSPTAIGGDEISGIRQILMPNFASQFGRAYEKTVSIVVYAGTDLVFKRSPNNLSR